MRWDSTEFEIELFQLLKSARLVIQNWQSRREIFLIKKRFNDDEEDDNVQGEGGCLSVQGSGYPPVTRDSSDFVPQTHFVPPKTHFHDIFVRGGRKNSLLRGCEYTKSLSTIA